MSSGQRNERAAGAAAAPAGANGAAGAHAGATAADGLDPQILESILQATLREHGRAPLPPALAALVARNRGREPDEPLVVELVAAALGDFWSSPVASPHRAAVCEAVARRLVDDPVSMDRIRRLLQSDPEDLR